MTVSICMNLLLISYDGPRHWPMGGLPTNESQPDADGQTDRQTQAHGQKDGHEETDTQSPLGSLIASSRQCYLLRSMTGNMAEQSVTFDLSPGHA